MAYNSFNYRNYRNLIY